MGGIGMGSRQALVDFVRDWCEDPIHGYDQNDRWGPNCDCSSLMYMAANAAGYDIGTGSGYTGTMLDDFQAAGFTALGFDGNLWDSPAGTIMLSVGNHTEMDVGDCFGGAHIDENGDIAGGQSGDQTGNEVSLCGKYDYPWDYALIPPEDDGSGDDGGGGTDDGGGSSDGDHPQDGTTGDGVEYEVYTGNGWLGAVSRVDNSDNGFAGSNRSPIYGIRAHRIDGQPISITAHLQDGTLLGQTTFGDSLFGENQDGDGISGNEDSGCSPIDYLIVTGCRTRVSADGETYFAWEETDGSTPDGDGLAGNPGSPIVCVQMMA